MDKIYKCEYIAGQKGKNKLFGDGFFYIQEKKTDDTIYWKCEQYKKKCKSRVIDKLGDLRRKQTHNHEGNPEKFEVPNKNDEHHQTTSESWQRSSAFVAFQSVH
jgi:hypothetical protein